MRTIVQSIEYQRTTSDELFALYTDSNTHGKLIGAKVSVSPRTGDQFSAFDGAVTGKNLLMVPDRLIVQSWRGNAWEEHDTDSILVLAFEDVENGARIHMTHANVPEQFIDRWSELYWEPLKSML